MRNIPDADLVAILAAILHAPQPANVLGEADRRRIGECVEAATRILQRARDFVAHRPEDEE